jgi:hypothetical protein
MEEDEVGLRREIGDIQAMTCGSCGRILTPREHHRLATPHLDEAGAPFTVVCADCFRAIESGEVDLATVEEAAAEEEGG